MRRLHVLAEGQTEEAFVNQVLAPHLAGFGVVADVRCVTTRRDRHRPDRVFRGGVREFAKVQRDLDRWMREDGSAVFTTMIDLYALPDDFPGCADAARMNDPYARVRHLERSMAETLGGDRLIPYIQLHEFEALLFSDPEKFDWHYIEHAPQIERLAVLANQSRADRRRRADRAVQAHHREIPEYAFQKTTAGPLIAGRIGIQTMRARCPHFAQWIGKLEALAGKPD